jgi:purine-nucleoside phosphorylase
VVERDAYWAQALEAAGYLQQRGCGAPLVAIQCGSGLAPLIAALWPDGPEAAGGGRCGFSAVPHLAAVGVAGHGTEVLWGDLVGREGPRRVLVFSGRLHLYEGHTPLTAAFPVAIAAALGCRLFLLTNAAGALNQHYALGDAMVQTDFINLQGDNPLAHLACPPTADTAEPGPSGIAHLTRFVDPKPAYDPEASALLAGCLNAAGLAVHSGVYVALRGPLYETHAELVMLRGCGADAVGMSSVAELALCHFFRLPAVGVSIVTNECFSTAPVTHAAVVAASHAAAASLGAALRSFAVGWAPL